ncbi:hypothetical protein SERLA73DRAFT_151829 [Serpula lacrymans var. lacrymans S7.3]|uniref:Uncharacterized protein n=1 Tax=Serpula lacrymans var. lacrymans (strain S7.3) TaxID=936435 RepID=F8PT07_SERL3|nr:hypothetical protein SERLA73DRAFT_151829 [Serpula lacrymans var. lacrymans S7.3]
MSRPNTHAKNAHQHPGQIILDAQSKRQSCAEVEEEKVRKRITREEVELGTRAALEPIATVESRQAREDNDMHMHMLPPSQWRIIRPTGEEPVINKSFPLVDKSELELGNPNLAVNDEEDTISISSAAKAACCCGDKTKLQVNGSSDKRLAKNMRPDGKQKSHSRTLEPEEIHKPAGIERWANKVPARGAQTKDEEETEYQEGGFEDEDEIEGREAMVGKKWTTASSMVKIDRIMSLAPVSKCIKAENGRAIGIKSKNSDLPYGCLEGGQWRSVFVPTYTKWLGTTNNPWCTTDNAALSALQTTWERVFPDISYSVSIHDPVYCVLSQCFSECSDPEFNTYEARQDFSKAMLDQLYFLYADTSNSSQLCGVFRSEFILQTFASHLNTISTAVDIQALERARSKTDIGKYPPRGALAICAAAVERVFTLWAKADMQWEPIDDTHEKGKGKQAQAILKPAPKLNMATGKATGSHATFSDVNWGPKTRSYYDSICKLKDGLLDNIVKKALTYTKGHLKLKEQEDSTGQSMDPRAFLMDL